MKLHVDIEVHGRVQGVGFRASARGVATALGLTGFARNLPGGGVYMEVEGELDAVNTFLQWCKKGPGWARVDSVTSHKAPMRGFAVFEVR